MEQSKLKQALDKLHEKKQNLKIAQLDILQSVQEIEELLIETMSEKVDNTDLMAHTDEIKEI